MGIRSSFSKFGGFITLGSDVNKSKQEQLETAEGVVSVELPELKLTTPDINLIDLKKQWENIYRGYNTKIRKRQKRNEKYWLGKHDFSFLSVENLAPETDAGENVSLNDNLIFKALETFLPQATSKGADPVVAGDETKEGKILADNVRKMLIHLADKLRLRLKVKNIVRYHALYFLGVGKLGWDFENNEIAFTKIRPQRLILDPEASIDEGGIYTGEYIGEIRKDSANVLVKRFPEKADFIKEEVNKKMGTQVQYIEWWADGGEILFWTLKDQVLKKMKNPHWNYDTKENFTDEYGISDVRDVIGRNHFVTPQFPYVFLTQYNLGLQPHDETGLIEQNIANQDLITKRYRQIDDNVDGINGGWAISGSKSGIKKEQAADVIQAFRDGEGVWIPEGSVGEAVQHMVGTGLPNDVFNQLNDARIQLEDIFGISGSTPSGIKNESTVRGKILVAGQDQSRIGGGISEFIEQFYDRTYNWMVQLMYVYYDEPHVASIVGRDKASETIQLVNTDLIIDLLVSVKEGSMIPKDPLTQANQAIDLAKAGMISPLELHRRLDTPNPQEVVKELIDFQTGQAQASSGQTQPQPQPQPTQTPNLLSQIPIQ